MDAGVQSRADAAQADASDDAATTPARDGGAGGGHWLKADYLPKECSTDVWTGKQAPPDFPTFRWEPCPELEACERMVFALEGRPIDYGSPVGIDPYWAQVDGSSYVSVRNGPNDEFDRRAVYTAEGTMLVAWRSTPRSGGYCLPGAPRGRGRETGTVADFVYAGGNGINELVTILPTSQLGRPQAPQLRIDKAPSGGIGAAVDWDFSLHAMAFRFLSQDILIVSRRPGDARRFGRPWQELEGGTNMVAIADETAYWDEVSDRSRIHRANLDGCHDMAADFDGRDAKGIGTGPTHVAWFEKPANMDGPVAVMLAEHKPCGTPLEPEAMGAGFPTYVGGFIRVGDGLLAYLESNEPSIARVIDFEKRQQLSITFPHRLGAVKPPLYVDRELLVVSLLPRDDANLPDEPWRIDLRGRTWEPLVRLGTPLRTARSSMVYSPEPEGTSEGTCIVVSKP